MEALLSVVARALTRTDADARAVRPGCAGRMHKKVAAQEKFYLRACTCDRIFSKFEIAVRHIVGRSCKLGC